MALMRSHVVGHVVRHVVSRVVCRVVSGVVRHMVCGDFRAGQPEWVLTAGAWIFESYVDDRSKDVDQVDTNKYADISTTWGCK